MQPIGIFGGTFDPIHYGHLRLAEEMADALRLREVRFIPTGQPPHRAAPLASAQHRLEMTRRAIAGNPRFAVDDREVRATRPSYTVDTLTELRDELGAQQPLVLLLGADAFLGLASWHQWRRLFDLAHLAIAHRPGSPLQHALPEPVQREVEARWIKGSEPTSAGRLDGLGAAGSVSEFEMTPLAISGSAIRDALTRRGSVRYLTPEPVCDYLQQHHLYKS